MHLILEGPDNAGKTTLAQTIHHEVPSLVYHHPGGRPKDAAAEAQCLRDQTAIFEHPEVLMDRCTAISQQVYTPDPNLDLIRATWLHEAHERGIVFVYCRPSTDWLMSFDNFTWREGETEEFKQEIIAKQHVFIERYDSLMQHVPHVHYDYRDEEASEVRKHLVMAAGGNETSLNIIKSLINWGGAKCK